MKVLVTGGAGFIGFHVAKALLERGDEVVVVDNLNDYYDVNLKKARLAQIKDQIQFYEADVSDFAALKSIFQKHHFDKVCHLAAQAGVRYSLENPFAYQKANNVGTLTILELMKECGVKYLVFASSSSVYGGNTKIPFSADDRVDTPVSLYAATKKHNEDMAHVYHKLYGLHCFGLRFFTVYGPWGRPDMALFTFTKAMIDGKPIEVYNHGDHSRDFTYITDIVDGVVKALDKVQGFEIINLGNNRPVKLMYFISCIEKELGIEALKNFVPMQKGDVHQTFADIEKTKRILGWEPKTTIEQGIHNFVQWYQDYSVKKKQNGEKTIAVVGLGSVGLPLALAFAAHFPTIGFDVNAQRISELQQEDDHSRETSSEELKATNMLFTHDPKELKKANFIVVCVPTPIDDYNKPDLGFMESASKVVGENLSPKTIVVYESTVYPGVTEEVCVPILEKASQMKCGVDFKAGYSPERIDLGDKERTINKVVKIVSGMDEDSLNTIEQVYGKITKIHRAPSIKVAEAAKVIENIQRDLNIALMNELAVIFDKMQIPINDVLAAAGTKWNFHHYHPGLVGGHCIGVDPYYLTYKAEGVGHHPEVILAGRRINDNMHKFYAAKVLKILAKKERLQLSPSILVLGLTFKPNVADYRNSRVKHFIEELQEHNVRVFGYDPLLNKEIVEKSFGVQWHDPTTEKSAFNLTVLAVEHDELQTLLKNGTFTQTELFRLKDV